MALNRRQFLLGLPLSAGAVAACASSRRALRTTSPYLELATTNPGAGAKGTILVAMPDTTQTREVWTGLNDELGQEYRLVAIRADGPAATQAIGEGMRRYHPAALVLMNKPTVAA